MDNFNGRKYRFIVSYDVFDASADATGNRLIRSSNYIPANDKQEAKDKGLKKFMEENGHAVSPKTRIEIYHIDIFETNPNYKD